MTTNVNVDAQIETKMRATRVAVPAIAGFLKAVHKVMSGQTGLLPEDTIEPVKDLPRLVDITQRPGGDTILDHLAIIKLNGGLGTSMGLDRAKSLIPVKGADNFLDFIARQIIHLRNQRQGRGPAFYLMDSFTTQKDTLAYLDQYPGLAEGGTLDFLQNMVPKIEPKTFLPVAWPEQPELEWCPPGHGDIYPALLGSGVLDALLERGIRYLFVSNADNLGATIDLKLAQFFADTGWSFLMEVAERTPSDRKGGHLTRRRKDGRLVLRESVQCPKDDESFFQDIARHRYFNTNNLWIRLEHLSAELEKQGGSIELPLIKNVKNVDPRKPDSPKVLQLESAMGAAIECFAESGALAVPRSRFSPVKTTSDLLALRSDAYRVTADFRLVLVESRAGRPPVIELDANHYKLMAEFDALFPHGAPSLVNCESLKVTGKVQFSAGVTCRGQVEFINSSPELKTVRPGEYNNARFEL